MLEWIQNYKIVQYNAMFDAKRNKKHKCLENLPRV